MQRAFQVLAWGAVGAVLAAALIGGAFMLAGTSLTEPASAVRVVGPPLRAHADRHEPDRTPETNGTPDAGSPSSDPGAVSNVSVPDSLLPTVPDDGNVERGDD